MWAKSLILTIHSSHIPLLALGNGTRSSLFLGGLSKHFQQHILKEYNNRKGFKLDLPPTQDAPVANEGLGIGIPDPKNGS